MLVDTWKIGVFMPSTGNFRKMHFQTPDIIFSQKFRNVGYLDFYSEHWDILQVLWKIWEMSHCYLSLDTRSSILFVAVELSVMGWQIAIIILFAKVEIYLKYLRCCLLLVHEKNSYPWRHVSFSLHLLLIQRSQCVYYD